MLAEEALEGIFHKAGACHGSDTARYWGDHGCLFRTCRIIHIAAQFPCLRIAVDANVDHCRAFTYHVGCHEFRSSYRHHEDLSLGSDFCKILCAAVGDCDCGVAVEKEFRYRKTHDIAASDDNSFFFLRFPHQPCRAS